MTARLRGVYGHDLRRDETENAPCAREFTPRKPRKPRKPQVRG
jgi:hypothetical protein